ncbi:MAG: SDR family NAD(P)-dependent oxidoreductase [Phycisphaerales bacterium]|nr:SDR family NAD(P)-dependent oxidoreductase [Phycisphaerales bacterium]
MQPRSLIAGVLIVVAAFSVGATAQEQADRPTATPEGAQRAVLITGASSGIGRATAELLAAEGFHVYAGARSREDIDALNAIDNIEAIRIDVTDPAEIAAAVETVKAGGRGLYALSNNAGVAVIAPMIEVTEEDLDFQLDVNVYGPYRVTKAFAPLLIESKGRVYTTGSISGFVVWGFGGPYTMSKHAVEAFTDALAAELAPFGVQVGVVEPGNYKSEIMASMKQRMLDRGYAAEGSLYAEQLAGLMEMPADRAQYKEPDEVAHAFLAALTDETPKRRYMVVPNRGEAEITVRSVIARLVQLNDDQPYTFSREELIGMLDQALAGE